MKSKTFNHSIQKKAQQRHESSSAVNLVSFLLLCKVFQLARSFVHVLILLAEYFGYQVWANLYGFFSSGQKSASWTRLMTGGRRDDLAEHNLGLVRHCFVR